MITVFSKPTRSEWDSNWTDAIHCSLLYLLKRLLMKDCQVNFQTEPGANDGANNGENDGREDKRMLLP